MSQRKYEELGGGVWFVSLLLVLLTVLFGCRPNVVSNQVIVYVDGQSIPLSTTVLTVREALDKAGVNIGQDDRVDPDLWVEIEDGMSIHVIRVQEEVLVELEIVPYTQQTIRSEALPAGAQKLLQAGKNGQVEVTYRLRFEDGVEVARSILQRVVATEPVAQIVADFKELYASLRWGDPSSPGDLTTCLTFISGPSKTADIEATLVHGAHGPRALYLVVIDEK